MEEKSVEVKPPVAVKERKPSKKPSSAAPSASRPPAPLPKKLIQFDLDVLALVRSGDNTTDRLLLLTGIDSLQFAKRIDFLCSKNMLCRDASNPQVLRLGLNGYEQLAKKRVAEERKLARKRSAAQPAAEPGTSSAAKGASAVAANGIIYEPAAKENFPPDERAAVAPAPVPVPSPGGSRHDIDLFDLLRRGSPRNGDRPFTSTRNDFASRQAARAQAAQKPMPFEQQVRELGGKEAVRKMIEETTQSGMCELCRSPFKLSLNTEENNPKYGYCFCGAAYHKDCYESIVHSDSAACVRCGKTMRIQMDKASEEAVKAIKKLFD